MTIHRVRIIQKTIFYLLLVEVVFLLTVTIGLLGIKTKDSSQIIDSYLKQVEFSGTVLFAQNNRVVLREGYGTTDTSLQTYISPDTPFPLLSVTKSFTALAILQLVEDGKINLQDKVSKFVSDFPNGNSITIHDLLTHTSGLPSTQSKIPFPAQPVSQALEEYEQIVPVFKPHENYLYSNVGYQLLALIIEKASGMSYFEYLFKKITEPVGMLNTHHSLELLQHNDISTPVGRSLINQNNYKSVLFSTVTNTQFGAGGLYSNVDDLYNWVLAVNKDSLVKQESFQKMTAVHALSDIGYGWIVVIPQKIFWSSGHDIGFTSFVLNDLTQEQVLIILSNNDNSLFFNQEMRSLYVLAKKLEMIPLFFILKHSWLVLTGINLYLVTKGLYMLKLKQSREVQQNRPSLPVKMFLLVSSFAAIASFGITIFGIYKIVAIRSISLVVHFLPNLFILILNSSSFFLFFITVLTYTWYKHSR